MEDIALCDDTAPITPIEIEVSEEITETIDKPIKTTTRIQQIYPCKYCNKMLTTSSLKYYHHNNCEGYEKPVHRKYIKKVRKTKSEIIPEIEIIPEVITQVIPQVIPQVEVIPEPEVIRQVIPVRIKKNPINHQMLLINSSNQKRHRMSGLFQRTYK